MGNDQDGIGGLIIQYAKRKARKSREYLERLELRLAETEAFINSSPGPQ